MGFLFFALLGFISGAVPWALIIGKLFGNQDARNVGDGNPGATNAWKVGGWVPGLASLILEISKSLIPVYFAFQYLAHSVEGTLQSIGLAVVALAPILGHGWSPFLRFNGGKTLAASLGSWMAVTNGLAFPVGCALLGFMHGVQRNHAITTTVCLVGFMVVFLSLQLQPYIAFFWVANVVVVVHKHRHEYYDGILLRGWMLKLLGR